MCEDCRRRARARKDYRQGAVPPDEEVPRHRKKGPKPKHVHKWGEWTVLREERHLWWPRYRKRIVEVRQRRCRRCGHVETRTNW